MLPLRDPLSLCSVGMTLAGGNCYIVAYTYNVSVEVRNHCQFGISPQVFDVVELANVGQEYVNEDVTVVHSNPLCIA